MTTPVYDRIGNDYDVTRRADTYLATRMAHLLELRADGRYLDLACGTGNYTIALAARGGSWNGIDASAAMIERAREKSAAVQWECRPAEHLAVNGRYDGVLCVLALHHFDDLGAVCRQVRGAIRRGRFVIFTSTPSQMRGYWLNEYFPEAMARSIEQMPDADVVEQACLRAGFARVEREPYAVQPDLEDLFLYSGKHKPQVYLSAAVRAGISTFRLLADEEETQRGCRRLEEDLRSGRFRDGFARFDSQEGDYLFLRATAEGSERPTRKRSLLFSPGPTNVHDDVRQALLASDTCHREREFASVLAGLNEELVRVLGGEGTHASIPFVSSGTGANEAVLSAIRGKLLVLVAGTYSERIAHMARRLGIETEILPFPPLEGIDAAAVEAALDAQPGITHLFAVHHETTTGVIAPLGELGTICRRRGILLAVDGISSVGAHPFHLQRDGVALLTLNANKCLESIPGIAFVLARTDVLAALRGASRGDYFDLYEQWRSLMENGTTRFTTATQIVRAARLAVRRLVEEGYDQRVARYVRMRRRLLEGVIALGLEPVPIPAGKESNLHVLVHQPAGISYAELHDTLLARGITIYSDAGTIARGHLALATMGAIDENDVDHFLTELGEVLAEGDRR